MNYFLGVPKVNMRSETLAPICPLRRTLGGFIFLASLFFIFLQYYLELLQQEKVMNFRQRQTLELMIDRRPKNSDKEVLAELEKQLPNFPLGRSLL